MKKEKKRRTKGITLVLSGGGAKGLAHIGVIEILEENKIPIKRIVGTSMGSMVGGFYAAGKLLELKKLFLSLSKWDVFKLLFSFPSHEGIFNLKKVDIILKNYLEDRKIQNLKIPYTAVAFDIVKGKKVLFQKGLLVHAIRASISDPSFFRPFRQGNSVLVDGGVVDVVPVDVALKQARHTPIIASNAETKPTVKMTKFNLLTMFDYSRNYLMTKVAQLEQEGADVILEPHSNTTHWEYYKAREIISAGRRSAKLAIPRIKRLIR